MIHHAHILVVDDQLEQQIILRAMLRRAGCYCVDICSTGQEALQLLEAQPDVNLVLLDCVMPEMTGIDVCHRIRKIEGHEDTPVIMVTAAQDVYLLDVAFAAGATDYIRKPCERLEIMARVNSALQLRDEMQQRHDSNQLLQKLLRRILPVSVAGELESTGKFEPRSFKNLSVFFVDFVDFTKQSSACNSSELLGILNNLFDAFDTISKHYQLERLKTVGDEYQGISLLHQQKFHRPLFAVAAVKDMLWLQKMWYQHRKKEGKPAWLGRAAVNVGPMHAGIVGIQRFQFDVWGPAINHVKCMCNLADQGEIIVSEDVFHQLSGVFDAQPHVNINLKGEGEISLLTIKTKDSERLKEEICRLIGSEHENWHSQVLPELLHDALHSKTTNAWENTIMDQR
ncbi:MAG: response regulator [Mariprofundaceae bacterium]|nr:response regulator [Mariprofundaceae bacterium]